MTSIKFEASQARCINQYKNLRIEVLKFCANIYFNRQCLKQGIVPKYAKIKIAYTSPASIVTQKTTRVTDYIKCLYKKKDMLNKSLYKVHLQAALERGNSCKKSLNCNKTWCDWRTLSYFMSVTPAYITLQHVQHILKNEFTTFLHQTSTFAILWRWRCFDFTSQNHTVGHFKWSWEKIISQKKRNDYWKAGGI